MKIEIDTKDIAEAMANNVDNDNLLEVISDDILRYNPEWWTKRVVEPIKNDILKLMKTNEFCKNMVNYLLEETEIEQEIIKIVSDKITEDIKTKLPKPTVVWGESIEAYREKVEKNNQAEKDKAFKEYVAKCGKN